MMDFCGMVGRTEPVGKYRIRLGAKAVNALAARDVALFVANQVNWAEDGARLVIGQILHCGEVNERGEPQASKRVSDYLGNCYPETFTKSQLRTATDGTRRPLLYRIKFMLRCLSRVVAYYEQFHPWVISDLRMTLDILVECVGQSVGKSRAVRLEKWCKRFYRLWDVTGDVNCDVASVRKEFDILLSDVDGIFESIRDAYKELEGKEEDKDGLREAIERLSESNESVASETRATRRQNAQLTAKALAAEPVDPYSRLAGLERLTGCKRKQVLDCIRYSHEKGFRIARGDKTGGNSLKRLAELVWKEHKTEYDALAKLKDDPGYKNVASLAGKLYKLAQRYPQADHFLWG